MKTILHITQCLSGGGAGRELVYLARYSMDASEFHHKIATLSPSTPGGLKLAEEYDVSVIEIPSRELLENEIENADITQVSWWNNPEVTNFLHSYIPDTRLIIRYHVAGHTAPQCIVKEHLDMADLNVISYNKLPLLQQFEESWKKERVDWILHGTDLMRIGDTNRKFHQAFNVGYIGTVSFVKMHPDYVKMSNEINIPDIKFVICGNIEEESIPRQVNKFSAQHKFDFKGYVDNIGEIISEIDVFGYPLCPDTYASTDLVLQEVMYAGVPAVVFNYGGLAQTVKDGHNGIIVNSGKEYKEAIEYLYHNPTERERLGKNAKSYVEKNLGIHNTVKKYHSVYKRLLEKNKTWHQWGKDSHKPLLEQSISYQDITGEPPKRKTADIFIASMGKYGDCFANSMDSNLSNSELFAIDEAISNVSDIIYRIGILWYRTYDPKDAYLNFWAGLALKSRQNTMQAIDCWATAHQNGFDHWRLYWYMAESLKECGKETEALKLYQYLSRIKPDWEEIIKRINPQKDVSVISTIGKLSAETIYRDIKLSPKNDKSKKTINKLEDFLESYPDYALAHNDLGVLLYNQGEKEKVHYHYQQAVQLDPENITFQKNLADFYYVELGQVEEALQIYVKILKTNPEDVETLLILGHICIALEKFDDAKSFYNSVLNIEPQNTYARESLEKLEKHQLSLVTGQLDQTNIELDSKGYLVSVIVSTYNAERFIGGRLEDLENQTIADRLEIIVIDSGSQQDEETIIKEFQEKYSNIKYIKTNRRETVYAAWNRGIKASQGKYITNANTDDRLRKDALEVMVNTLEAHPEISLVYADVIITETENETFERCTPVGNFKWLNFNRDDLLNKGCFVGPQPMWRREVHDEYGYFDASFVTSGDYEFWLRLSQSHTFLHLPVQLGLYLRSPGSIEHSNRDKQREENHQILAMYKEAKASGKIIGRIQASPSPDPVEARSESMKSPESIYQGIQAEMGNKQPEEVISELEVLAASYPEFALAHNDLGVLHSHAGNKGKAHQFYEKAVQLDPENMVFLKNMADFYCIELGRIEDALRIYVNILKSDPQDVEILMATGQICKALERPDDAREFFNQVLQIESWNVDARKQIEEMKRLPSGASLNSESAEDAYRRLQEKLNTLTPEEAIVEFEKIVEFYPDFAVGHNDLGNLYYNTGSKEKAVHHYRQAAHLQPENTALQKNLADFLFVELGKVEEALQIYVDILARHPDDVETLLISGHICVALKKFDDAKDFYQRVLALEPDHEDANQNLQALINRQGQRSSARPDSLKSEVGSSTKAEVADMDADESENQDAEHQTIASIIISLDGIQNRLKQCIESIAAHTQEPHEVVLINNGVTKGVSKWAQDLVQDNAHYQLVKCDQTQSRAQDLNQAAKAAAGEYLVLMHNDVMVADHWLSGMLECFRSGFAIGVVGPMTNETSGIQKAYFSDDRDPNRLESDARAFYEQNRYRRIPEKQLTSFCLVFRRELIDKIGDFDAQLGSEQAAVTDFCKRSTAWGFQNLIAGDVFVYHADRHKRNRKTSDNGQVPSEDQKRLKENWNKMKGDRRFSKSTQMMSLLDTVNKLHQGGYVDQAVETLLNAIGAAPEETRLYLALAEISISLKRYQDAIDTLNEMPADAKTEMESEETDNLNEPGLQSPSLVISENHEMKTLEILGYAEEGLENFAAAEAYADRMLAIDPKSARALNLKGILAYRKEDSKSAEQFFEKSVASDPGAGEPYSNLATVKLAANQEEEARELFEKAFILNPTDLDIATNYHTLVAARGEHKRAEDVVREASAIYPNNQKINYMLIDVLLQQGKHEEAMGKIEAAIIKFGIEDGILAAALKVREKVGPMAIQPAKKKAAVSCCMIIKDEEKYLARCLASVKPIADEMIVVDTGSTDRSKDIATAFGAQVYDLEWKKDFAKARNFSLEKASGDWVLILDGDEVISALDYTHFNRIVKNRPKAPVAYSIVTRNYSALANIVGWVPNDGKYVNEEAAAGWIPSIKTRLFYGKDQIWFEGAVHELVDPIVKRKGFETKQCSIPVHHYGRLDKERLKRKGEVYFEIGKKKMEEMGDDIPAVREMAIQATTLEENEMAIELWQKLISLDPPELMAADAYINMATLYNRLSNFEQAVSVAKKAVAKAPHIKESLYNYALAELHVGNAQATINVLEDLVKRMPDYPPAQFILSAAYFCIGEKEKGFKIIKDLQGTDMGPNLVYPIFELGETLLEAQRTEYALLLLGTAIEYDIVNKPILELFNKCIQIRDTAKNSPERPRSLPLDGQSINFENLPQ